MIRNDKIQVVGSEQQAKFIQDRITGVEKHFGELCSSFSDYARKTARLRDKGDELSNVIRDYAASETVNKSLSAGLLNVSTTFYAIEEYRNAEVQRIETKTYAESELLKASAEMSRTAKTLSEQTDFFEKRKLQQLKDILKDFIKIEMSFHCKALELLTVAHQQVAAIDDKADLENFRKKMKSPEKTPKSDMQPNSGSLASLLSHHNPTPSDDSHASTDSNDSEQTDDTESSSEDHN